MILCPENGRLGNQLFQYYGLRKYFPNQKLIFFGFDELYKTFEEIDAVFISRDRLQKWLKLSLTSKVLFWFADIRLIGLITELSKSERFATKTRKGLLPNVYLFKGYFQHADTLALLSDIPKLKREFILAAEEWLMSKGVYAQQRELVFAHIRRGDYLTWPSREHPAVLDLKWYKRAMAEISTKIENPFFVLMSDDIHYVKDIFEESESLIISENKMEVDLAIMALCSHGILSASTFAWWGGYLSKFRQFPPETPNFIAPQYWAGHKIKSWFPANFKTSWITYIE